MITNECQCQVAKHQLSKLQKALEDFDMKEVAEHTGSEILAIAERDALESMVSSLVNQVREYETN